MDKWSFYEWSWKNNFLGILKLSKWKLSTSNRKFYFGSWKTCSSKKENCKRQFVNREFRKVIYTRSRPRNKYWKNPTSENKLRFKQRRNKCVFPRKKSIKLYLSKLAADCTVTNKSFWEFIKAFLKNKTCHAQNDMLIRNDEIITEEKDLAETFNKHYIKILLKILVE